MPDGRLFYVVGASGLEKGGLLDYVRTRPQDPQRVVFAHRYVTRAAGGDNDVALSEAEFLLRMRHGLFAMDWESGGLRYGIGTEINYWLAMTLSVVVNGSRGYLERALNRYPDMTVIWVSAAPERVATRRARRGHDAHSPVAERYVRSPTSSSHAGCKVVHIRNGGSLRDAGDSLLAVLHQDRT